MQGKKIKQVIELWDLPYQPVGANCHNNDVCQRYETESAIYSFPPNKKKDSAICRYEGRNSTIIMTSSLGDCCILQNSTNRISHPPTLAF